MIEIKNLVKNYSDEFGFKINLIGGISAEMEAGKITVFLAPVGSGKSSLLKILAGIETLSSGDIKNPDSGPVVLIPSAPSSFPWLNVYQNISIPNSKKDEINGLVKFVGLEGYENHYAHNKSLGFRFRIALARALAANPSAVAIDEPFSKMESETRKECYLPLRKTISEYKVPVIFATTNITEAVFLADKIYLMKKEPAEIIADETVDFDEPRSLSVIDSKKFADYRDGIALKFKNLDSQKLFNISI